MELIEDSIERELVFEPLGSHLNRGHFLAAENGPRARPPSTAGLACVLGCSFRQGASQSTGEPSTAICYICTLHSVDNSVNTEENPKVYNMPR